jgi:uncharacterized protein (DUF58 family)
VSEAGPASTAQPRRELQPTPRLAVWFGVSSLGLLLEPIAPGASLASMAAYLVLGMLLWNDHSRLRRCERLDLTRQREPVFSLGASNPVELQLVNPTDDAFDVEVIDEAPAEFRTPRDEFRFRLQGRSLWTHHYVTVPNKRGDYEFGGLNVTARSSLGLLALHQRQMPAPREVRVYPNLHDLRNVALFGLQDQLQRLGLRKVRAPEVGREFESLRDYQSGDEWRTVDWKATARRSRLTVRQFDVERSQKILLVLDLGRTMSTRLGELNKADLAINACVLLCTVASHLDDRVGVLAFADKMLGFHPPGRGKTQAARMLEFLYPLEAVTRESDYQMAFREIVTRLRSRTLVVLFTDLVDPESSSQLIAQLAVLATRHAVLCVALADYELDSILEQAPQEAIDLYRQTVARTLLDDRDQAAARLTARGVGVMKARPKDLSVQVVNRYLQWKTTGRL